MARKGKSAEEIIGFLLEAEVRIAQGETAGKICRGAGISEQTYYKWRRAYGERLVEQLAAGIVARCEQNTLSMDLVVRGGTRASYIELDEHVAHLGHGQAGADDRAMEIGIEIEGMGTSGRECELGSGRRLLPQPKRGRRLGCEHGNVPRAPGIDLLVKAHLQALLWDITIGRLAPRSCRRLLGEAAEVLGRRRPRRSRCRDRAPPRVDMIAAAGELHAHAAREPDPGLETRVPHGDDHRYLRLDRLQNLWAQPTPLNLPKRLRMTTSAAAIPRDARMCIEAPDNRAGSRLHAVGAIPRGSDNRCTR